MPQLFAPMGSPVPPVPTDETAIDQRPYDPAHALPAVAQRLLVVQRSADLTTLDMARAIASTEAEVVDWLEGRFLPPIKEMNRLAKLVGFTLHWLYHGDVEGMAPGLAVRLRLIAEE